MSCDFLSIELKCFYACVKFVLNPDNLLRMILNKFSCHLHRIVYLILIVLKAL